MRLRLMLFVVVGLLLVSAAPLLAQDVPSFEPADCPFMMMPGGGRTIDCGYLTVPEDRTDPDNTDTIRLAVAIFRAESETPAPDPIIYLEGGPGGNALEIYGTAFNLIFGPFAEARDFIILDQRGVGFSEPALDCPEYTDVVLDQLAADIDPAEERAQLFDALLACRDRLAEQDVDFEAYNSAQNAADVNDLRIALGYDEVNLYGISYGTRLALTVLRDFPEGVRSVILDSTYPLEADLNVETPANTERAFEQLFAACAADAECATTYPDLESVFYEAVAALDADPVLADVTIPVRNETYEALIDGDVLIGVTFQALYSAELIPTLPELIYNASEGNVSQLSQILGLLLLNQDFISVGMYFSVQCNEEVPFTTPEQLAGATEAIDEALADYYESDPEYTTALIDLCAAWVEADPTPAENQPVTSDVPTLILAGEFDPITPPRWGEAVAESLPNSYYFEFPAVGHGASVSDACPTAVAQAFLDDPATAPDVACIAEVAAPDFVLAELELEPLVTNTYETVIPAGWEEIMPGTGTYAESANAQTVLLIQAVPGPSSMLLGLLAGQLGVDELGDPATTLETGAGLSWDIYRDLEVQGLPGALAVTESGGQTYLVILFSASQFEIFYDLVLVPAVENFFPLE
jgi:pimeloyl-ACP methyl ester carboxylesterase